MILDFTISICVFIVAIPVCAQKPTITYHSDNVLQKVSPKILKNARLGIADTTLAMIRGQVFDDKRQGVECVLTIYLSDSIANLFTDRGLKIYRNDSSSKIFVDTDSAGRFSFYLNAQKLVVNFNPGGYGTITVDSIPLTSGEIRELQISVGSRRKSREWISNSADTLYFKPKKKQKTKLRRQKLRTTSYWQKRASIPL